MNRTMFKTSLKPYTGNDLSGIKQGVLNLPDDFLVNGDAIAFGEDDNYLHCVIHPSGIYFGIYKNSGLDNHIWEHVLRLNIDNEGQLN